MQPLAFSLLLTCFVQKKLFKNSPRWQEATSRHSSTWFSLSVVANALAVRSPLIPRPTTKYVWKVIINSKPKLFFWSNNKNNKNKGLAGYELIRNQKFCLGVLFQDPEKPSWAGGILDITSQTSGWKALFGSHPALT